MGALLVVWLFYLVSLQAQQSPNILILFVDDMGYGDFFGRVNINLPNVKKLQEEGLTFTNWLTAAPICTPSRAALLTGRFPLRSGIWTTSITRTFILPGQPAGLSTDEITIAEVLKAKGYATGMTGKWHLGVNELSLLNPQNGHFLPPNHGFDESTLISPMGNNPGCNNTLTDNLFCQLYTGTQLRQQPWDTTSLTTRMVNKTQAFIRAQKNGPNPFFYYVSFYLVHTPFLTQPEFTDKSQGGRFGDMMEEMDWAVGEIMKEVPENTIVFWLSDNGPYLEDYLEGPPENKSSAGPFKGGKGQTWEGGFRVPSIVHYPPYIKANTTTNMVATTMDIMATSMTLAGYNLNQLGVNQNGYSFSEVTIEGTKFKKIKNKILDGKDLSQILFADRIANPSVDQTLTPVWPFFPYFCENQIIGARYNDIKIHWKTQKFVTANLVSSPQAESCECCPSVTDFNVSQLLPDVLLAFSLINLSSLEGVKLALPGVCNCNAGSLNDWSSSPLMFNLTSDPGESTVLTSSNFPAYNTYKNTANTLKSAYLSSVSPVPPPEEDKLLPLQQPCCALLPEPCGCHFST